MMLFNRIQNRILLLFVGLVIGIVFLSGWLLDWSIRRSLEAELGRKLIAVAQTVSASLDPEEIAVLLEGAGPRTARRLDEKIHRFRTETEAARIYLFDLRKRVLLDTRTDDPNQTSNVQLLFFDSEIQAVANGRPAHSILFQGLDGHPAMTGFSPVAADGIVLAGVAVEGSATFLAAARRMRNRLYGIAALSVFSAVVLGLFLARTITHPIKRLVAASGRMGNGDYSSPVPESGKDEIGHLARTMEVMRQNILERENELKALVAGVAHEIRNPLGGMELFAGLLRDEVKPGTPASQHVDHVVLEIDHLKKTVNRFLDFARPQKPVQESCPLRQAIQSCLDLMDMRNAERPVRIDNRIDPADRVWIDPNHLKEILLNLLKNALEAMPNGGALTVESRRDGSFLAIRITDTGKGIPESARTQIFTPFFTTRTDGTGLGLSIAKSLAETNGGRLRLIDTGPGGTIFEIRLQIGE